MKKRLSTAVILLVSIIAIAQPKPKQKEKEKAPTQKEMQDMMKEAQKELDNISPEDKKMMDSMGIKMPDMKSLQKSVSGISDAQLKKAYDDESRIVPLKDAARITAAMAITLSNADINAYISKTQQAVLNKLPAADKTKAAAIYQQILSLKTSVANTAVGFWINGQPTVALYLMGEACKANVSNAINLNNYASFLTMCGAEQLALPLLNNLNKRYPKNSSILNNITQAWLGLGDITKAEKYADSTVRIYPHHPQANMAKCLIDESRGNMQAAIQDALNAITKLYSTEKESKLKKLGHELKSEDLTWDRPMPQDPMGLGHFNWPEYPMEAERSKPLEKLWMDFKNDCQQKINSLQIKQASLEKASMEASTKRMADILQASQKGEFIQPVPGFAPKAMKKLAYLVDGVNGNMSFVFEKEMQQVVRALTNAAAYGDQMEENEKAFNKKYEDQIGEGKPNPTEAMCSDENGIITQYLSATNSAMETANRSYLNFVRKKTSDLLYYYQYTLWPDQFELAKVNAEIGWLTQIKDQRVFFKDKSHWCGTAKPKPQKPGVLQNFDDVHCEYVSTMDLGVYKITSSCSNLVGEFDFGGVKIDFKDNVETGKYSGSAMVGTSKSLEGPAGAELEASIAALVEWDNSGVTDWGAIAGVAANAGGNTIAGTDVKITINSGVSTSGKGILQGIK
jgi:tetratricopeptide (TPR) repeat protein